MNTPTPTADGNIPITVIMRCYNDAPILPRTLAALAAQRGVAVTVIVFESASTDGSRAIVAAQAGFAIVDLAPGTYWSSTVLNQGLARAETDLVAFVNSDAVLVDECCLARLAAAIQADAGCAASFARQVPRADCSPCTRMDLATAFEWRHELGIHADCLSMVCSMVRRSVWEALPFDEALTFAEDYVWSRAAQARGFHIRYVPEAVAEHSHEYTFSQQYRRSFGDAAAMSRIAKAPPTGNILTGVILPWGKRCLRDAWRLVRLGHPGAVWRLPAYRWPKMLGEWHGARAGWHCFQVPGGGTRQPRL